MIPIIGAPPSCHPSKQLLLLRLHSRVIFPNKHFLSSQVVMHTAAGRAVVKSKVYLGLKPRSATHCDLRQMTESLFCPLQY